jgi:ABC-type glycerol-3-phosphate transport system permease component
MAQHAAQVGRVPARSSADALRPARKLFGRFGLHLIAILLGIILLLPFYWALSSSLKQMHEVRQIPPIWFPSVPQWHNYADVWRVRLWVDWFSNTVFITIVPTIGVIFSTSLAGYAFARFRFPGKAVLFSMTMATLMLPGYVLLIPNFLLFWKLGWLNTYLPLTIPFYFGGFVGGFYIFLFRQFFLTIPLELDEAARIDGASYPHIFWSIVLPLSLPAFASAAIIEGIRQWNSFLLPFIVLNKPEYYPLSVGLRYFVVNPADGQPRDHLLMAAAVSMTIPVLLIFYIGQRYFVRGVAMTGIKG